MSHSELIAHRDGFLKLLATTKEPALDDAAAWTEVSTGQGPEPQWVVDRWFVMFDEINKRRVLLGKGTVALEAVRVAESNASGHVDYAEKFSLYCAELVMS